MADYYVKSGSGVTQFAASTAYSTGQRIVPATGDTGTNYGIARRWVWECTTAGTTAAGNPTWPASVTKDSTTVTSGTAVFRARQPGFSSGTTADWTFATPIMMYVCGSSGMLAAGDNVWVSSSHNESTAVQLALVGPSTATNPVKAISVDDSAAPPTAFAEGAKVTTTYSGSASIQGALFIDGIDYEFGNAQNANYNLSVAQAAANEGTTIRRSLIRNTATGTGVQCSVGAAGRDDRHDVILEDVQFYFSSFGNYAFSVQSQSLTLRSFSALPLFHALSDVPVSLFAPNVNGAVCVADGYDLTGLGSGCYLVSGINTTGTARILFRSCKLNASLAGVVTSVTGPEVIVDMDNCDSADTQYRKARHTGVGSVVSETTRVMTGGASNGVTPISWALASNSAASFPATSLNSGELVSPFNTAVGSSVTVTVELLHDSATALKASDLVLEVIALTTSGTPYGRWYSSAPDYPALGSDLPSSGATWTTTGISNPNKQKVSVTFTPQEIGPFVGRLRLFKASKTVYANPQLIVS
jgi:hypothetical protein